MKNGLIGLFILAVGAVVGVSLMQCSKTIPKHAGEASWTLQGETSHLDCPGQHAWYVEVEETLFFMGCR